MLTTKDKIKERVIYFSQLPSVVYSVYQNKDSVKLQKLNGFENLVAMTYKYTINDIEIAYEKWFMQGFELASKMNIPGCEHHDKLIRGTGVNITLRNNGKFVFHGQDANDIINAFEKNCDIQSYIMENQNIRNR